MMIKLNRSLLVYLLSAALVFAMGTAAHASKEGASNAARVSDNGGIGDNGRAAYAERTSEPFVRRAAVSVPDEAVSSASSLASAVAPSASKDVSAPTHNPNAKAQGASPTGAAAASVQARAAAETAAAKAAAQAIAAKLQPAAATMTTTAGATPPAATLYEVTAYFLNVRSKPYKTSDIVAVLEKGMQVEVAGRTAGGWAALKDGGYVHGSYLAEAGASPASAAAAAAEPKRRLEIGRAHV